MAILHHTHTSPNPAQSLDRGLGRLQTRFGCSRKEKRLPFWRDFEIRSANLPTHS